MSDEIDVQDVTEEPEAVETEAEAEEMVITIGDQAEEDADEGDDDGAEAAPDTDDGVRENKTIRFLRKRANQAERLEAQLREANKKNAELEAQIQPKAAPKLVLPPEPKPADFDYDDAKLKAAYREWLGLEAKVKAQEAAEREEREAINKDWQVRKATFDEGKAAIKVPSPYSEAESALVSVIGKDRFAGIIRYVKDPVRVVYALGNNPTEAKRLAAIKDPGDFLAETVRLEPTLKATPRKPSARPETAIRGSGQSPAATSANIEKLRAEAERTGNYSAYLAAKRKLAG